MFKKISYLFVFTLISASLVFAGNPFGSQPIQEALDIYDGGEGYEVNAHYVWQWANSYYSFEPADVTPEKGIIIYPGGAVDERSYAVLAKSLALEGYLVVIVPMPVDLAILGFNRANKVISNSNFSGITKWVISGHSLGGSMSCNYAKKNTDKVDAVILLASYPSNMYRLDGTSLKVLSIYGTEDGMCTLQDIADSVQHLPSDAEFYEIIGGNHSQFGYYTPDSSGDNPATISREDQTNEIINAIIDFMPGI